MFTQEEINKFKSWAANQGYDDVSDAEAIQILYDIASKDPQSPYYDTINGKKSNQNGLNISSSNNTNISNTNTTNTNATDINTSNTSNIPNISNTSNTSNTSNISNANSVTNNDTINGVTTEEQTPVTETTKEGNTINGVENQSKPQESINTTSKGNKSEALSGLRELLSRQGIGEDKLKELEAGDSETSINQDSLDAILNKYGYENIDAAKGDLSAIREYYENNPDATEKDFKDYIAANPQIARSLGLLTALFKTKGGGLRKILGRPFRELASSKLVQWLSKAGPGYVGASAVGLLTDVVPDTVDRAKGYVGQNRTLDREGNDLPHWKQFLWGVLNNTEKTFGLGIPSTVMEIANEYWPRYQENLGWEVPRENTQEQQEEGKIDKKVRETYKKSNTYKGLNELNKLSKKYGDDEVDLAMTLMNSAMTTMNKYGLLNGDKITSEGWFEDFEYDPKRHNRYYKSDGSSMFDVIDALSRLDETNG